MTRIAIISDTHSLWDEGYVKYLRDCDQIWHAGDIGSEQLAEQLNQIAPLTAVAGNIDGANIRRKYGEFNTFTVDGVKVCMTHIGGYPYRYASGIKRQLQQHKPNIFISGHSHILKVIYDRELNLLHINPGAAGNHGWQRVRTLVLLEIDNAKITNCQVIELAKR